MRIVVLIRDLPVGGAQRQLAELAKGLQRRGHKIVVVVFYEGGQTQAELQAAGVNVVGLGKRRRWNNIRFVWRLARLLRALDPEIVYTYTHTAALVCALLRWLLPGRLVWGVRAASVDSGNHDWLSKAAYWAETRLAPLADLVITNSQAGRQKFVTRGCPERRVIVVPNGVDTNQFAIAKNEGLPLRSGWGVSSSNILIGIVARLDPIKDHRTFLRAAARVASRYPNVRFVCIGDGAPGYRAELQRFATAAGVAERVIWAGDRADMRAVYNAIDLLVLSSLGEGFPNAVAEAMACGVPCVATDVGDTRVLMGECGEVVPPGDPAALANGIERMLTRLFNRAEIGCDLEVRCRQRIVERFASDFLVKRIENVFFQLAGTPKARVST